MKTPRHLLHYPVKDDPFNPGSDLGRLATSADNAFPVIYVTDAAPWPTGPSGPPPLGDPRKGDLWLRYVQEPPTGPPTGP